MGLLFSYEKSSGKRVDQRRTQMHEFKGLGAEGKLVAVYHTSPASLSFSGSRDRFGPKARARGGAPTVGYWRHPVGKKQKFEEE